MYYDQRPYHKYPITFTISVRSIDMVILISGRGSNMEALLKSINSGVIQANALAVISNKPTAPGLEIAKRFGTECIVEENLDNLDNVLATYSPDLVCLAGFMRILPPNITAKYTIMNIHPSLLPLYPGLRAPDQAIKAKAKYSGCTVHFVEEGVDTGPIILQAAVPVLDSDTPEILADRILEKEHIIYSQAVNAFIQGRLSRTPVETGC